MTRWTTDTEQRLGAFVREQLEQQGTAQSLNQIKRWIASGKVQVDGIVETSPGRPLQPGQEVALNMAAPRPRDSMNEVRIVHDDPHIVVIDKPAGISSVPWEKREQGTAMDLVRDAWRRMGKAATSTPLLVVHRIDKATSGLLVFAKSKRAELELGSQFRDHSVKRIYRCVAHGKLLSARIESRFVRDRGDGLRGSTRRPNEGKRAVTHVRGVEFLRRATLCEVRLETGKTHQIRIHLSEQGHPLVGESVYIRNYQEPLIDSSRLLLHAATLGFRHPVRPEQMAFESELPADFRAELVSLRRP